MWLLMISRFQCFPSSFCGTHTDVGADLMENTWQSICVCMRVCVNVCSDASVCTCVLVFLRWLLTAGMWLARDTWPPTGLRTVSLVPQPLMCLNFSGQQNMRLPTFKYNFALMHQLPVSLPVTCLTVGKLLVVLSLEFFFLHVVSSPVTWMLCCPPAGPSSPYAPPGFFSKTKCECRRKKRCLICVVCFFVLFVLLQLFLCCLNEEHD